MMRGGEACRELFAIERGTSQVSREREELSDRTEARQESLGALWIAKATHASLAFACRLMTVFKHPAQRVV
ncbi:hypothetical protein SAMN05192539_104844 [Paraburkholderia diazotrophica]|uniref:Uncharacterized protein n=1 Tax=Paraburkholderia diazotrophica TaxID=667676 RepID=A0A1H7E9N4_9BURK|nr:hypothetical protein SAMN05192539_104844 [Paraburkholderia diazotrophica]